ncbi:MAG: DHCW motif cupin fold protein [Bacteroidetes bacterium]|nr:DHCW motif cupin fold protein [Bacteroidota bacterium]
MRIENIPFEVTDWSKQASAGTVGRSGSVFSREIDRGDMRIRLVEYSALYEADHWCSKGHILWVLEGDMTIELEGGKRYDLKEGTSMLVGDNVVPHKAYSKDGAKIIIID